MVSQFRNDRLPLENQHHLKEDDHRTADLPCETRPKNKPRSNEFRQVIESYAESQQPVWARSETIGSTDSAGVEFQNDNRAP